MILFVAAKLKEIFEQGKDYMWEKPKVCPKCKSCRLWGHGFVLVNFTVKIPRGLSAPLPTAPQLLDLLLLFQATMIIYH